MKLDSVDAWDDKVLLEIDKEPLFPNVRPVVRVMMVW